MRAHVVAAAFALSLGCVAFTTAVYTGTPYNTPPRGWDSYDSNPIWRNASITETQFLYQVSQLAYFKGPDGTTPSYQLAIIDEGWAESAEMGWLVDDFGRPTVNPALFPSAGTGQGLLPLSTKLQAMGISLGLWIIKGIPRIAVEMNLPIENSPYRARDIFINKTCPWHRDVFYVNGSHPGGQDYYASLVSLYGTQWQAAYLKMDCVFGEDLDGPEIAAMASAISSPSAPVMALSLSPGKDATPAMALANAVGKANAYRITNDLWDCFSYLDTSKPACVGGHSVINTTQTIIQFALAGLLAYSNNTLVGTAYPDPDMLAFGFIGLGGPHRSQFTRANERYVYGLWTITQSPIILGGDMSTYSMDTTEMIQSKMSWMAHQLTTAPMLLAYRTVDVHDANATGFTAWQANHSQILGAFFVGYFPYAAAPALQPSNATLAIPVAWPGTVAEFPEFDIFDAFRDTKIGKVAHGGPMTVTLPYNDGGLYFLLPRDV